MESNDSTVVLGDLLVRFVEPSSGALTAHDHHRCVVAKVCTSLWEIGIVTVPSSSVMISQKINHEARPPEEYVAFIGLHRPPPVLVLGEVTDLSPIPVVRALGRTNWAVTSTSQVRSLRTLVCCVLITK